MLTKQCARESCTSGTCSVIIASWLPKQMVFRCGVTAGREHQTDKVSLRRRRPTDEKRKKAKWMCVPLATAAWGHSIVANKGVDDWNHFPARQMRPSASFFTAVGTSAYWLSCDDQLILLRRTTWCAHNAQGCDVNWRPNTSRADQSIFLLPSHTGDWIECPAWIFHANPLDARGAEEGEELPLTWVIWSCSIVPNKGVKELVNACLLKKVLVNHMFRTIKVYDWILKLYSL